MRRLDRIHTRPSSPGPDVSRNAIAIQVVSLLATCTVHGMHSVAAVQCRYSTSSVRVGGYTEAAAVIVHQNQRCTRKDRPHDH